jgi:HlyD family secretion protein
MRFFVLTYSSPGRARSRTLACVLAAGLAQGACNGAAGARAVEFARVERRDIEDVFLLTGELQAVRSEELTVPRNDTGRVQIKWVAEDGSEVEANQPVCELDNTQVAQSLEERRLRLTQAQIALEGRESSLAAETSQKRFELEHAETEAQKAAIQAAVPAELQARKDWNEKQQALRRTESERAKARLGLQAFEQSSQADVEVLRIARDKAARDVSAAQESLSQLSLVAPKAGIVMLRNPPNEDRPVQAGDTLWPGWRVISIPDLSAMELVAVLPEVDDGRVMPGQKTRVALETDLARSFAGHVIEVAAVAQDARYAGGFRVRIALDQPDPALMRPGLSARVEVVRRVFERALVVPRRAVVRTGNQTSVRRAGRDGLAAVRVAACLPLDCVIESGLEEGDRVALP